MTPHASRSPWLHQVPPRASFSAYPHKEKRSDDVVIVGGGIAGVSTAHFLLTFTDRTVTLLEAHRIASGATGHNAGQMVRYFERSFTELVALFGKEKARESHRLLEEALGDIQRIVQEYDLRASLILTQGYAGLQDGESVLRMASDLRTQERLGIRVEELLLASDVAAVKRLPAHIRERATLLPQKDILALLETEDKRYFAALSGQKGCMNSALFCDELVRTLREKYPERFIVHEESPIERITLTRAHHAGLSMRGGGTLRARDVVLCTNGFTSFHIETPEGSDLDRWFHRTVQTSIGYMAGYLEERSLPPAAVSFLPPHVQGVSAYEAPAYMYVTRRPYTTASHVHANLVCIGGPEREVTPYETPHDPDHHPEEAEQAFAHFLHTIWKRRGRKKGFDFLWSGRMGYTPDGVRMVGQDPEYSSLWYNIGCNGVGILSSVMGGKRIAQRMRGDMLAPSFFDIDLHPRKTFSHQEIFFAELMLGALALLGVLGAVLILPLLRT